MPPNPPSNAHGFAMRSMSLRDMQIPNSEKKIIGPPPSQILGTPLYMDYQKAFDKVAYGRLLTKLKAYNFSSEVINWIKEYLTDRSQCVEVNGKASEWLPVTNGIPQGSVLGPLLSLIYINDLHDNIISDVYIYADDTKLYREIKTIEDQRILQKDLDTLTN